MNIFYLSDSIEESVKLHCDKHIVKMPTETAQMLSAAHWLTGSQAPYKLSKAHAKHPCNLWLTQSIQNYNWLVQFGKVLSQEFSYRYNKDHKALQVIHWAESNLPPLPDIEFTKPPQCMDQMFRKDSVVDGYRNFYNYDKATFCQWTKRPIPEWFEEGIIFYALSNHCSVTF